MRELTHCCKIIFTNATRPPFFLPRATTLPAQWPFSDHFARFDPQNPGPPLPARTPGIARWRFCRFGLVGSHDGQNFYLPAVRKRVHDGHGPHVVVVGADIGVQNQVDPYLLRPLLRISTCKTGTYK